MLQSFAADEIRVVIRKVRAMKGLTNEGIAASLGWDTRKVTNALASSHMLRVVTARPILETLQKAYPRTKQAQKLIASAATNLLYVTTAQPLPPQPAVLISPWGTGAFAAFLADAIAETFGAGAAKRELLRSQIAEVLSQKHRELTRYFVRACFSRSVGTSAVEAVLFAFGYQHTAEELFPLKGRNK